MTDPHHVYFVPGMFGFGRLAGYDYFVHLRRELDRRFADAGIPMISGLVPTPPTSSLRFRAGVLAKMVSRSADGKGPVHLIGHSTGGLDVRLVLSPSTSLRVEPDSFGWRRRVCSAVSLNTPHYGTPLASYFASVAGTRVLYALSLLTVVSLSVGEPSLAVLSKLLSGLGGVDQLLGGNLRLISRATELVLRFVDEEGRGEISEFLSKIQIDQGAVIQIMPEAMDLFNASTEDDPRVRYGAIATAAPVPRALRFAKRVRSPYSALTAAMFATLHRLTAQRPKPYPYAEPSAEVAAELARATGVPVDDEANDGVVPTLSMLWGELVWAGQADHLDVIGHFSDDGPQPPGEPEHVDWVMSGARFDRRRFGSMMDALAAFLMESAEERG
ncbi:MAG: hypothetical protein OZ921_21020 [Sorangiineae bacterium]|nr:hypothetical protein [Polyangiaceae bacterium]MEB2325010.1 hypothetical protein [Sorangiineae bacterium]